MPVLSKLIEKLMRSRALKFIDDNKILFEGQYGFRSGCSTADDILQYVDDCTSALVNKLFTISIILDFSKTFDTVNKEIMLHKLERLVFRVTMNNYFCEYRSKRKAQSCQYQ